MKKALAWLLVLSMTAALAVGGTLAYLTDTDEDVNVMTVGKVKIDQLEYERVDPETNGDDAVVQEFHNNKPLYPAVTEDGFDWDKTNGKVDWDQIGKDGYDSGIWNPDSINNEQDKMVFVKNKGDFDAYVRTVFAFEAGSYETLDEYLADVHFNLNDTNWTWEWSEPPVEIGGGKYFIATATYNKVLAPGALTEISLSQIALDPSVTNEDIAGFGETYQVLVQSQAVQADGFESAPIALAEAFGELIFDGAEDETPPFEVNPDDVPFEDDNPVKGTDLNTALNYLNGDATGTAITAQVKTITFGDEDTYASAVSGKQGTLVDAEQDTDAYAYYILRNDGGYDVYVLSDDTIYAPKDSTKLFNGMNALTSVNLEELDVSRTEVLYAAFQNCKSLTTLDVSTWDTSNITNMAGAFVNCNALKEIKGTENWDLSKVTTMFAAFRYCYALTSIDATGWDLSSATSLKETFNGCNALKEIKGAENWDTSNVTDMNATFQNCKVLETLDVSTWDTSEVTGTSMMFAWCHELSGLDVSDWDVGKMQNMYGMFYQCYDLTELDVSQWNPVSATNLGFLFAGCTGLTRLESGNWTTDSVTNTESMYSGAENLEYVDVSNFNMSQVTNARIMFNNCKKLKELDVSKWDTGNITTMEGMFNHCEVLEYLDVSNWDTSKVTIMGTIFQQCWALKELDVSNWDTSSATTMGWTFYGCHNLEVIDISNWDTSKVTVMSHMFADCNKVKELKVDNWDLSSLTSLDATFNDCDSIVTLNVGKWNTATVKEFSQTFESCDSLQYIYGLENWDTSNGRIFDEMFNASYSLKELNLSSFDTRNVTPGHKNVNGDKSKGFSLTFSGVNSLEKLVLGENFIFAGNGSVTAENQPKFPAPANVEGSDGKWYNVETGVGYLPSEIPEGAATYVAVNPNP